MESHRGYDEVIALQADGSKGDEDAEQPCQQHHQGCYDKERQVELHEEECSDIGSDAVERGLAHGQQVGHADGQVCTQRQHHIDAQHDDDMKYVLHLYTVRCLYPAMPCGRRKSRMSRTRKVTAFCQLEAN